MNKIPPKYWLKFFRWFCDPNYVEDIEGDLLERFEKRPSRWFFILEVLKLFRPSIIRNFEGTKRLNYYGMFKHNLKIGWRSLLKNKSYSLINILGLSTGAAVCLIVLVFYRYETSFDHRHTHAEKTYRVVQHTQLPNEEFYWNTTAYPLASALRNDFPDFEKITQTAGPMKRLFSLEKEGDKPIRFEEEHVLFVDKYYPQVFDFEWLAGDANTALEELNAVIISDKIARKCFGENYQPTNAIGKTLMLNNKDALVISGIIENPPATSNLKSNMLVSFEFFKKHNPYPVGNWSGNYQGTTFVVLSNSENKIPLENSINKWKKKYLNEGDDQRISYFLQPIREIHTETKYGSTPGGYQIAQKVLNLSLAVAGFILFIAIINFINLVTARSAIRAREVGVKKIIGGSKTTIIGQFFIENSLLVIISLAISVLVIIPTIGWLNQFLAIINMKLQLQVADIIVATVLCFGVIVLASIYPAIILSSFKPISILNKTHYRPGKGGLGFRKGLTLIQFSIVQFFVISAIVVGLQLRYFQNTDLGFKSDKIVMITIPSSDKTELFKSELSKQAGFQNISVGSGPPMSVEDFALGTNYWLPQEGKAQSRNAEMKIADAAYLELYDLKLIAGRNFTENKQRFDEFIVSRSTIESINLTPESAIGKQLFINEGPATIVGVVEDFHNHSLQNDFTPVIFTNWSSFMWKAHIKVPSFTSIIEIEQIWKEVFPASIFNYSFVDDAIEREYLIEKLIFSGFKTLSILVIIIGSLGLFGLISFLTIQKVKEVGIRKILGASMTQILSLFTREFSLLIMIAFAIASPLSWHFMSEWLASFTYHISLQVWMFLAGGIITFAIAGFVTISKTFKTAMANPVDSIRNE